MVALLVLMILLECTQIVPVDTFNCHVTCFSSVHSLLSLASTQYLQGSTAALPMWPHFSICTVCSCGNLHICWRIGNHVCRHFNVLLAVAYSFDMSLSSLVDIFLNTSSAASSGTGTQDLLAISSYLKVLPLSTS